MTNSASRKWFNLKADIQLLCDSKNIKSTKHKRCKTKEIQGVGANCPTGCRSGRERNMQGPHVSGAHKETRINSPGCKGAVFSGCPIMSRSICNPFI